MPGTDAGWRVTRPPRCRDGAGGRRWPSQPGSAKANRKASGDRIYSAGVGGEVIYCGSSEVGTGDF